MGSEIIIIPAMCFMVGFIVYILVEGSRRRQQVKALTEFHAKLLDRLGSAKEFAEFFTSDAGARFMELMSSREGGAPQMRILRSMQTGLVLLALGVGFFIMLDMRTFQIEAADGLMVMATAATSIGVALVISTGLSYLLSKRMGLIGQPSRRDQDLPRSV
jgi:hypothetical protein